jgi:hypothetical protein
MHAFAAADAARDVEGVDELDALHRLHVAKVRSYAEAVLDLGADPLKSRLHLARRHLLVVLLKELVEVRNGARLKFAQWAERRGESRHASDSGGAGTKKAAPGQLGLGTTLGG